MYYKTRLPIRGLLPVFVRNLKNFRDGWWLKLIVITAILGIAPTLKAHASMVMSFAGICIIVYTVALWRSFRFQRSGDEIFIRSGLAEKLRVSLHTSQISRVDIERDQWCLMLGLVIVCIYTEGNDEASAKIEYVTPAAAHKIAGDLLPEHEPAHEKELFYRMSILDAMKAACLVPLKQLLVPAMIVFAVAMPLLNTTADRPEDKLMQEGAVENVSTVFTKKISPGAMSPIILMALVLILLLGTAARVLFAFPYFLRTQIRFADGQIYVRSGLFNLRQWRLRIEDIGTIEQRHGVWTRLFGGSAILLQTRGAALRQGMKGSYLPYLPNRKIKELCEFVGVQRTTLPKSRINGVNFCIDMGRVAYKVLPLLAGLVLFLPPSFWTGSDLKYYAAEFAGLFLTYTLWRWREHWNSGFAITSDNVEVGQRRWTKNQTSCNPRELHGLETYSLPWWGDRLISIKPGLPGVKERITSTAPWRTSDCINDSKRAAGHKGKLSR